jgi:hypothetical protein
MAATTGLETHQLQTTIRFIQGYRYLDRCGETLIRLENSLADGWIPVETTPASGAIKNDLLGMVATFNSSGMTVLQQEFVSFEHFRDQTCKLYETLWRTLELENINAPTAKVVLQKGFKDGTIEDAQDYLRGLNLCTPRPDLLAFMDGPANAVDFTLVTEKDDTWSGVPVHRRRRLQAMVIRQEKHAAFDDRLLQRTRLLPQRQREAMAGLMELRRRHPEVAPVAAQLDLEDSLETEFRAKEFDLPGLLEQTWQWAEKFKTEASRWQKNNA